MSTVETLREVARLTEERDYRDPELRLESLFDAGSLRIVGDEEATGVLVGHGFIGGRPVVAYATDATVKGGALGYAGCLQIVEAIDAAVIQHAPVIGMWHSGGARLAEGVEALDGVGQMFAAMVRASGRVPQISVVLGPAAGGAAYGPALTDVVVMGPGGRAFVTGPEVVRSVTGEQVDMETLGGPGTHGKSGVVHVTESSDEAAIERARELASLLGHRGRFSLTSMEDGPDLSVKLPEQANRAYDVRPLVRGLFDGTSVELQAKWAPNIVTALGRVGGHTVGVLANNPLRLGGCLDSISAEKAARFVRMCDAFGVPLVVVVDVPGYLPGLGQETEGVVRRGAKLLHAFAQSVVPRVTLVTRKAYGGAYIAMNSRSLGASAVYAWPGAEVAVMGHSAAVNILHRKKLAAAPEEEREQLRERLVAEHAEIAGGVERALALGVVDEVIDPAQTRRRIAETLAAAPPGRGPHTNIPL